MLHCIYSLNFFIFFKVDYKKRKLNYKIYTLVKNNYFDKNFYSNGCNNQAFYLALKILALYFQYKYQVTYLQFTHVITDSP